MIMVLGFLAIFGIVFGGVIVLFRMKARRDELKKDADTWVAGEKRRVESAQDEASRANQRMDWK
jgi:outer membrane murein-binding lipoprotein Lpp